jgi:hypothetical protein
MALRRHFDLKIVILMLLAAKNLRGFYLRGDQGKLLIYLFLASARKIFKFFKNSRGR